MKVRLRGVPVKATDGKAIVSEPVTYTWVVGDRRRGQPAAGSISQPSIAAPTHSAPVQHGLCKCIDKAGAMQERPPLSDNSALICQGERSVASSDTSASIGLFYFLLI